ncbi:MAG TPA: LamG-like jellyroll fold domain-containing protein [Candidatus Paceibacterota bacterium]|nr:LamG-like jellyroll fold domain-containing protein [Candidatus Paceibacterota bacterium]
MVHRGSHSAFTLIELLVVIAIIAILAVVVVLTLNPAELLRQSRDANRISDMATLQNAINLYSVDQSGASSYSLGTSTVVYVSMPDSSPTCGDLGLPALPAGDSYSCGSATSSRANASGWIPINFQNISSGAPISALPVDATNNSSSWLYYTYTTAGGKYQITAHLESQKYLASEPASGGADPLLYTAGTNLSLAPFAGGMAAWWPLNEGAGTTAYDDSGFGHNGTLYASTTPTAFWTTSGCKLAACPGFSGGSLYFVSTTYPNVVTNTNIFTWTAWFDMNNTGNVVIVGNRYGSTWMKLTPSAWEVTGGIIANVLPKNQWEQVVIVKSGQNYSYYLNGSLVGAATGPSTNATLPFYIGYDPNFPGDGSMTGQMNNVRIYERALSGSEIQALYNAGE